MGLEDGEVTKFKVRSQTSVVKSWSEGASLYRVHFYGAFEIKKTGKPEDAQLAFIIAGLRHNLRG